MSFFSKSSRVLLLSAMLVVPATGLSAQQGQVDGDVLTTTYGGGIPDPSEMTAGPKIEGIISARGGDQIQVTRTDGSNTIIALTETTRITASGGFLGLNRNKLAADSLLNGLPVTIETLQWDGGLVAREVDLKSRDLRTVAMIRGGTDQRFAEQTAATEALRSRMGDIDQYNIKGTTNVHFDTGKSVLSAQAKTELCTAAATAEGMDNALLLVVGYTDSTGSEEVNQVLSERRAGRVVNHLQQQCGWKPYRMLSPTGMATADPLADNSTPQGKAQNRRVAVNILVSKAVDGL